MDRWARAARLMDQYEETHADSWKPLATDYDGHEIRYHLLELCRDCLGYAMEIGMHPQTNTVTPQQMAVFGRMYINTMEVIDQNIDYLNCIILPLHSLGTINGSELVILKWFDDVFHNICGYIAPLWPIFNNRVTDATLTPLVGNSPSTPALREPEVAPSSQPRPDTQDSQA